MEQKGRCVHCRSDMTVPDSYADGDHIKCGACATQHRILRTGSQLRLVIADVGPLREELLALQQRIARLDNELHAARGSFGLGVNGLGIAVIYVLVQVAWDQEDLTQRLLINAALIALGSGIFLELANFLFLSKRKLINQLSGELQLMRDETKELQRKIREGGLRR
jgi:predicted membrane protein